MRNPTGVRGETLPAFTAGAENFPPLHKPERKEFNRKVSIKLKTLNSMNQSCILYIRENENERIASQSHNNEAPISFNS
jgi:hypothetical protein